MRLRDIKAEIDREMDTEGKILAHTSIYSRDTGQIRFVLIRYEFEYRNRRYVRERLVKANRERVLSNELTFADNLR